ncbi:MAG TPA: arginase family protein [candidate division Zixibacteria bacterium]|nr:arginase family protein [candidate division Zixibacteria bacterium]
MSTPTFLGLPAVQPSALRPGDASIVILGIPHGVPYPDPGPTAGCALAPAAIRARSARLGPFIGHHDFDVDGPMLPPGSPLRLADGGDVPGSPEDAAGNLERAEATVRAVLDAGAVPIVLGGDDSIPIPVLRAYRGRRPIWVLHVDAHLDFRHEVAGVREGYSSPMRRATELDEVTGIVHVGLRGVGSARDADVADARASGNQLVTARELRAHGVGPVLERLPREASVFIAFDCDGMDPSVLPAVSAASPGGLSYDEAADLLAGVARRCRVAGAAFTELLPERDLNGISALVVTRLVMRLMAAMARSATLA